ncbi:hypothetical protein BKA70DRAFT_713999 [Coprinopsis sp. MPI-PUGE-AT-0042]|nr:hypothetical protein BKA70DRAFT_713999 [Coprinopsis sp. MPI-PUGE-AT-0042]
MPTQTENSCPLCVSPLNSRVTRISGSSSFSLPKPSAQPPPMLSVAREPQEQPGGATVQRSRSRLVRLLTSAKKTTTTNTNERSTSPPSGAGLRAKPSIKRPPAAASAFSKEHREAALRARGLLPPLPVKDLSQLEREQDIMIPVVSLPQVNEAPGDAEGGGASAADLIKKQWEAKNLDEETIQRQRLQTFKFGGASTTDLTASAAGDVQSSDKPDLGLPAAQGSNLPNADRSLLVEQHHPKHDTNLPPPPSSTGGNNCDTKPPVLPDVLVSGSEDLSNLWSSETSTTAAHPQMSSPCLLPNPSPHPTPEKDDADTAHLSTVTRHESTRTTATSTSSSSIPPSLDNTSSRTLSSSSEELSLLAYARASTELKDATLSSSPSIGGGGKLKGLAPGLRVVPGGPTHDIPVIIENGEDQTLSEEPMDLKVAAAEPSVAAGDETTVRGDSPRGHFNSQALPAEANDDGAQAAPPVPPRDRATVKANEEGQSPTPQLHFESTATHAQPLPPSRKRGMTLDSSTARSPSDSANVAPVQAPVRRKTLNPFKKRGQKDRSVSPGRQDPGTTSPKSTFGKIGRSVVGSVLRPSRQQTAPSSPRSPYLQAQPIDDLPSLGQNQTSPPSSPRLGASRSQSPPSSPSRRGGVAYGGIFQQQQQQVPAPEDMVVRQAVSPTFYSHGTIQEEASAIRDEEQRRVTEMAFLY